MSRLASLVWLFLGVAASAARAAETPDISFKTTPRLERLRPFADPIDLSILVTGADGRPIKNGSVAIRLDAPKPGRVFSTDYPRVEGTLLNEMRLPVRQGRAAWKYLFPIRGHYRLAVEFMDEAGVTARKEFTFRVRENYQKLWILAGFSLALLVFGYVAGRVFTRTAVALVLVAGGVLCFASRASTHDPGETGPPAPGLEVEPATVGRPSLVRWHSISARDGSTARSALLTLSILHLEKQKVVFAVDQIAVTEDWSMKFHFPDGAGYRVNVVAETPGEPPVRSEQVIAVTGVEPPAKASAAALAYFVALIVVGLGVGRWSKRRAEGDR